jgi:hypothetical protein
MGEGHPGPRLGVLRVRSESSSLPMNLKSLEMAFSPKNGTGESPSVSNSWMVPTPPSQLEAL